MTNQKPGNFKVLFSFYTNIETVKLIISLYLINVFCSEGSKLNSVEFRIAWVLEKNFKYGKSYGISLDIEFGKMSKVYVGKLGAEPLDERKRFSLAYA